MLLYTIRINDGRSLMGTYWHVCVNKGFEGMWGGDVNKEKRIVSGTMNFDLIGL